MAIAVLKKSINFIDFFIKKFFCQKTFMNHPPKLPKRNPTLATLISLQNLYMFRPRSLCDGSTNPETEPTCGRPLGLKFDKNTCNLYIADAYFGLLIVGPNGGVAQQVTTSAEGIPFGFTNALDVDTQTGVVYFTDSSTVFQRRYVY